MRRAHDLVRWAVSLALLGAFATNAFAAIAPGTRLRVTEKSGARTTEGRFVTAEPQLTLLSQPHGDTLRFDDAEVARVQALTDSPGRRSVPGTILGGLFIGGLTLVGTFYAALADERGFASENAWLVIGGGTAAATLLGGYLGGRAVRTVDWRESSLNECRER